MHICEAKGQEGKPVVVFDGARSSSVVSTLRAARLVYERWHRRTLAFLTRKPTREPILLSRSSFPSLVAALVVTVAIILSTLAGAETVVGASYRNRSAMLPTLSSGAEESELASVGGSSSGGPLPTTATLDPTSHASSQVSF